MTSSNEEPISSSPITKPKKRKWLRFSVLFILLLSLLGVLVNGPIIRWIIHDQIEKYVASQNLKGSFTLSGTLLSGFTVSDASYSGDNGIQQVDLKKAAVHYTLSDLLDKKIGLIECIDATVVLDIAKFPPSDEPEKEAMVAVREALANVRPWVTNPNIEIKGLDATLLNESKSLAAFQFGRMSHAAESAEFKLTDFTAQDGERVNTSSQDILLEWRENSATIDRWELLPEVVVENTSLDWTEALVGESNILLDQASLHASINDEIVVELLKGKLSSKWVQGKIGMTIPAGFIIDRLKLNVDDWKGSLKQWEVSAQVGVVEASYEDYTLSKSSIDLKQHGESYEVIANGDLNGTALDTKLVGTWHDMTAGKWWESTKVHYSLTTEAIGSLPDPWMIDFPEVSYNNVAISLEGDIELIDLELARANTNASMVGVVVNGTSLPSMNISADLQEDIVSLRADLNEKDKELLKLNATYHIDDNSYSGKLSITESDPTWLNALVQLSELDMSLSGKTQLSWVGSGNTSLTDANVIQQGELNISDLTLNFPDVSPIKMSVKANYTYPNSIQLKDLHIAEKEWSADTAMTAWDGKQLTISSLLIKNKDRVVTELSGEIPFFLEIKTPEDFLSQKGKLACTIKTNTLTLNEIQKWTGAEIPESVTAETEAYIELSGSPADMVITGYHHVSKIRGLNPNIKEALTAKLNFSSTGEIIKVNSTVKEGEIERFVADGVFPFTPKEWIKNPEVLGEMIRDSPLKASINIHSFPLARISQFVPELEKVVGVVSAKGYFDGTINAPSYRLDVQAKVPTIKIDNEEIGDVKNVILDAYVTEDLIISNKIKAQINGGKFEVTGKVDLNDYKNPIFDILLNCEYALIHRNDYLSARASADLSLKGTMNDATLSGSVGIVESLFYKDMELIPIGVPSSEVAKVQLPAISSDAGDELPIPKPFSDWKLDLVIKTQDPVLLRGNVATGYVDGSVKLTGSLKAPVPNGAFYIKDMKAKLPFSILKVDKGEVRFTPETGIMNPQIKIPGKSTLGSYDVNLLIYGDTSSPSTSLSSSPPLPESEIMSLLATGSTTSALASSEAVAFKAFQVFLMKMNQREDRPGGNKLFEALLTGIDKLNLQVGDVDQFSGRKFTSASLEITPSWNFTTQIDEDQQTRGLLVYLIRFR